MPAITTIRSTVAPPMRRRPLSRAAARSASGWQVVSDTSYGDYVDVPRRVMQGYCVMAEEAVRQLAGEPPTHVFVQAGCGGLAASITAYFWETWGSLRPRLIVVEPERADCVYRSIEADTRVQVAGDLDTIMADPARRDQRCLGHTR